MTIAVAVKKGPDIVLAADSQHHFGDQRELAPNHNASKIQPLGGSLIAVSGWALYANILEDYGARRPLPAAAGRTAVFRYFLKFWKELHDKYPFVNDQCAKDNEDSPFGDLGSEFLMVNRQGIFKVCCDLSIAEFNQYAAIGSGGDYALGALHALYESDLDAETLARRAIAAAMRFDTQCGGETCVFKVKTVMKDKRTPPKP